jgi:hypothetical protein
MKGCELLTLDSPLDSFSLSNHQNNVYNAAFAPIDSRVQYHHYITLTIANEKHHRPSISGWSSLLCVPQVDEKKLSSLMKIRGLSL